MKRILIIVLCCFAALALVFAGAGMYLKSHLKELTGRLAGFELEMAELSVQYFPPAIRVKGLALDHEGSSLKVPSLKLYPDITMLLSGKVFLKDAVLDEPSVVADASKRPEMKDPAGKRRPFSTASFPAKRVQVNQGRFALKGLGGAILPLAVTGEMESTEHGIQVDLKSAVIEELGFRFSGKILIASISPLIVTVKSEEGIFNPSSVIDFLLKFGYLESEMAGKLPRVKAIQSKGITLAIDRSPEIEAIAASMDTLALDQAEIKGVNVRLGKGGAFEVAFSQALLDAGSIYSWISDNPAAKESLDKLFGQAKLKGLEAKGALELSALSFAGNWQEPQKMSGSMDIRAKDLVLKVVSEKGEEQQFTIKELESKVTVKDGKPSLQVSQLLIQPQAGGAGRISGRVSFPVEMKALEMKVSFKDFKAFENTINLTMEKPKGHKLIFDFGLTNPSLKLLAKGMAQEPAKKKLDLEARLDHLQIVREPSDGEPRSETTGEDRPRRFDIGLISGKTFTAEAVVRNFQFDDFPQIRNVQFEVRVENDKAVLRGSLILCDLNLAVDALMIPPSTIASQLEGRAINVDLTSLVACFSRTLPVFLAGRVSLSATVFARGTDTDSMLQDADGDFMITLNGCGVKRLSNLDYRLSFLLDMLKVAGLETRRLDSIDFSKASARANLQKGRLLFNSFSLTGPLMSAWGKGELMIKEKRLRISGQVRGGFGITRDLEIDKVLVKEEA